MATKTMQAKLDKMLSKGISDVTALGIELYDIIPAVRITKNNRRIGSAQDVNRAIGKRRGSHDTYVIAGKKPLFKISISEKECSNDLDIKNVIYHEILHCAPNCQNHQKTWKSHAAKVNKAYGLNVTVTKKASCESAKTGKAASVKDVKEYVGKCFRDGKRTFKFEGFNGRPKNNCDLVEVSTGKRFVCPASYVAKKMETSACLFGAGIEAPLPELPKTTPSVSAEQYLHLVGKKVKNGPRGRKVFTVTGIDVNGGSKAITFQDEWGAPYSAPLGVASRLVILN